MARYARYDGNVFEVPEGSSAEDVRASLTSVYPQLENATVTEVTEGNSTYIEFAVRASTKG